MDRSPFEVNRQILSSKLCQELSDAAIINNGEVFEEPIKNTDINDIISHSILPNIKSRYDSNIIKFDVYMESHGTNTIPAYKCESHVHSNNIWFRNKDIDFITLIFLKDHLETVYEPIDTSFEVYGGKLEFPTFDFGFLPERGTAITYPSVPNFINAIAKVKIGQLDVLRISHQSDKMFIYEPEKFKGSISSWFKDLN